MTGRAASVIALAGALGVLAFAMVILSLTSMKAAIALAPVLFAASLMILNPMAGLLLLVVFAHLDAIASLASGPLPVSLYKLLTAITIIGVVLASRDKPRQERLGPPSPTRSLALLFLLWMLLSAIWARDNGMSREFLTGIAGSMVLLFLITWLVDTPARLKLLVWALVFTGLVSAIVVILDTKLGVRLVATEAAATTAQFDGVERSSGASNYNPTTASHMLLATTVIAGILFVGYPRHRWFSGASLVLGLAALVFTLARSATLALLATLVVFAWNNRRHPKFPMFLLIGVAAMLAALPLLPDIFWQRMGTIFNAGLDRTLFRRLSYNLIGLDLIRQHPVLGVGPGNYPLYYVDDVYRWYPGRNPEPRQLHNSYLEVAAESGLVALGLFLGAMLSALRAAVEAARARIPEISPMARALAYGLGAFLVASVFMPNEDTKFMWILPGLCVAAAELARKTDPGGG